MFCQLEVVQVVKPIRAHANGVTAFNSGIALGVGLNNTASNVLDDYEEGVHTATLNYGKWNCFFTK